MTHARLAVAASLLLVLATACGSAQRQRASANAGTIVYESSSGCGETFYGIQPDGTGLSRLLRVRSCADVYWNRQGTKALVLEPVGPGIGPYILDARSGKRTPVPVKGLLRSINRPDQPWSPDGKRLLLSQGNANYSHDTDIVFDPRTHYWPTVDDGRKNGPPLWAPNGRGVLFPMAGGIELAEHGGFTTQVSLPRRWSIESLQLSGDGKWLSFVRYAAHPELYAVRFDGRDLHQIVRDVYVATWSPTGERLAFTTTKGLEVVDLATGHTKLVVRLPEDAVRGAASDTPPAWSPDGRWILYAHNDLGFGAPAYGHAQLWAVRDNGRDAHAVTDAFSEGNVAVAGNPLWASGRLFGHPVKGPPLVALPRPVLTTKLPVVALTALGGELAVATGFGRQPGEGVEEVPAPRGPIIRLGSNGRTSTLKPQGKCVTVSTLVLSSTTFGYVCDNSRFEQGRSVLWLGNKELVHAVGGQGIGTFLGGPVTDGHTIVYGVTAIPYPPPKNGPRYGTTRIYEERGSSIKLVRTLWGEETVAAIDGARIAVLISRRYTTLAVFAPGGRMKTSSLHMSYPSGVALDGGRLVTMENGRLIVRDLATGRKRIVRTARGSDASEAGLLAAHGDLAVYSIGSVLHVIRLSDGHEVVLDTHMGTGPVLAQFAGNRLYYAYNEAYSTTPGRVGFLSVGALERAISAHGRQAP